MLRELAKATRRNAGISRARGLNLTPVQPRAAQLALWRLLVLEPRARIDGVASFSDFEIKLGASAAAAVACRCDRLAGGYVFAHGFVETVVVAVQTEVALAVVDDRQQS